MLKISFRSYGRLSVRKLLNMREDLLNELAFPDPYINIKKKENEFFLQFLPDRVKMIDSLKDHKKLWEECFRGILGGNMFDWGAKAVTDIFDGANDGLLKFSAALGFIFPLIYALLNIQRKFKRGLGLSTISTPFTKNCRRTKAFAYFVTILELMLS